MLLALRAHHDFVRDFPVTLALVAVGAQAFAGGVRSDQVSRRCRSGAIVVVPSQSVRPIIFQYSPTNCSRGGRSSVNIENLLGAYSLDIIARGEMNGTDG